MTLNIKACNEIIGMRDKLMSYTHTHRHTYARNGQKSNMKKKKNRKKQRLSKEITFGMEKEIDEAMIGHFNQCIVRCTHE